MVSAARTVVPFGVYLVAVGLILLLIPNVLLTMLGLPNTDEPWIRVIGVVVLVLGSYYIASGRGEAVAFVRASVPGRLFGAGALVVIAVWFRYWPLLLFALPDAAGAVWTRSVLRRSADATSRP